MAFVFQTYSPTPALNPAEEPAATTLRARNIAGAIQHRLKCSPYGGSFYNVSYRSVDGRVTLQGTVSSYFLKQMLQEALRGIDHIDSLENQVEVRYELSREALCHAN